MRKDIEYYIKAFRMLRKECLSNLMYGYYSGVLDTLYRIRARFKINPYALEELMEVIEK